MKSSLKIFFIVLIALGFGCEYNNEEKLYGENNQDCNLENITFSGQVKPILQASCFACHSNAKAEDHGAGIALENYSDVVKLANSGKLIGTIRHDQGYPAMPQGGSKLTDCQISQIQAWIDAGKLNN